MQTQSPINRLLKKTCLTLFAILLPGLIIAQDDFSSTPVTEADEDATYSYTIIATDDGVVDNVAFSLSVSPSAPWLSINDTDANDGQAVLTGTPTNNEVGSYEVSITVNPETTPDTQVFTLTVNNTNDEPEFTSTPVTEVDEDATYSYTITATDADADDNPTFSLSVNPAAPWLSIDDSDASDGQAVLTGTPTNSDVGSYEVTLTANPSTTPITQVFTLTVTNTNDEPEFTSTPVTEVDEDATYSYTITASDADADDNPTFSLSVNPAAPWLSINDSDAIDGQAVLTGTPTNSDVGSYEVTLTANPSTTPITQVFTLTVTNTNDEPEFTSTPVTEVDEDATYSYTITATDADADDNPTFSLSVNPAAPWLSIDDSDASDGQAVLTGTPTNSDVGSYEVTLTANPSTTPITQVFTLTVTNTNDEPEFTSTPVTEVDEDATYSYTITATDADADDNPTFSLSVNPAAPWLSINDSDASDGQAVLTGTPTNSDVGSYEVTLTANPSTTPITQVFTLTVTNTNDEPEFTSTPVTEVDEDATYSYTITASDADADDNPTFSLSVNPAAPWLSINDSDASDGQAVLTGTPSNSDVGSYEVTLTANPSTTPITQVFTLTVTNTNDEPEFTSTPVTEVDEDATYSYTITATDADADDNPTFSLSVNPAAPWLSINDSDASDGQAVLTGTPTNSDVGSYEVTLTANPSTTPITQVFTLTVTNTNDEPEFTSTPVTEVDEDATYSYTITATDADADDNPTFSLSVNPAAPWLSINDSDASDGQAVLTGTPTNSDVGSYEVTLTANPSTTPITQVFTLTVNNTNDEPVFTSTPITGAAEDAVYSYTIIATDDDADQNPTFSLSVNPAAPWLSINDSDDSDGQAVLTGTPTNSDVGSYEVTLTANPSTTPITQVFTLTVSNSNDEPVFTSTPVTEVDEDATYSYTIIATDADADDNPTFSLSVNPAAAWLSINDADASDGQAVLTGTPTNSDVGSYEVTLTANPSTTPITQVFTLTVNNTNDEPVFTSTPITGAAEDAVYSYTIIATDADADQNPTFSLSVNPAAPWLSINDSDASDGQAVLTGTPTNSDVGSYEVTLTATPSTTPVTQVFTLTVSNSNDEPVFTSTPVTEVDEDATYSYTITATDADITDNPTFSLSVNPSAPWLSINDADASDGQAVLTGTPTNSDVGSYEVTLTANPSTTPITQVFTLTVNNTNDEPIFTSTPVTEADEDATYSYTIIATDDDVDDNPTFSLSVTPAADWLSINDTDTNDGQAVLTGTPTNSDVGSYEVTLTANPSTTPVTQVFTLTVNNTNDEPVFTSTPITGAAEDAVYSYTIIATDDDADQNPTFSLSVTPAADWLSINDTDTNDGQAVLTGTPTNSDVGSYEVTLTANPSTTPVTQVFTLTVSNSNDEPVFTSTPVTEVDEDATYSYTITATDADVTDNPTFSLSVNPSAPWLSINDADASDGQAVLTGTPTNSDVGSYEVTLTANPSTTPITQVFTLTVNNTNDEPVFTSTPVTEADEDATYSYTIIATDDDVDDNPTFSLNVDPAAPWLSINDADNSDGQAVLTGTPTNSDVGSYEVTLTANPSTTPVTQVFTLTVNNTNDEPVFTSTPLTEVDEDAVYSYTIIATDDDSDDNPTFSLSVNPAAAWLSINDTNPDDGQAVLTGIPTNSDVGTYEVTLTANPSTTPVTQIFTLTVVDLFGELTITQSANGAEGGTNGSFRINLSRQLVDATNITVSTSNNSAVEGDDFTIGTIQIPPNTSFVDVPVEIIDDDLVETDETVTITLNTSDNVDAIIASPDNVSITIADNDGFISISDDLTMNGEEGGNNGSFTITSSRQFPVATNITVLTSNNSAVIDNDFTIGTITLDANTSSVVVPVTVIDDDLAENTEDVTITLDAVTGNSNAHIAVSDISTTLAIADNDIPDLNITGGPFTITEGSSGNIFSVGLSAQPQNNVVVDISCVNPDISFTPATITFTNADWADKEISFSAAGDSDLLSETDPINISVNDAGSDDLFDGLSETIGLTVTDTDAAGIVITGGPLTADEGSTGNTFSVALAAQPASNVVIDISSVNTDIDFSPSSLTFTSSSWGDQEVSFTANEDDDLIDELDPIIVAVNNARSDDEFDDQSSVINLTINDNDIAELSIAGTTAAEEDATSGLFTITASQATLGETEISLNISGSAIMGTDYEAINSTLTMPDGSNALTIPINLIPDNLVEGLENVRIEMLSVNNDKSGISVSEATASINILDNDIADLVISQTTFSVNEGTNDHTFNVALSAQPQSDVVVDLVSNNPDISLSANTLTFTNESYGNQTVTFDCLDDDDLSDESANITIEVNNPLSNSLFYNLSSQITVDITDNDTQPEFTSTPITVTNEDAVYTYNINVSDADGDIPLITLVTPADPNSTWLSLTDNNDGTAVLSGIPLQADVTGSGDPIDVTIRAEDDLTSIEQSFTITVNNVNDSPLISNSSFSTPENQALTIALSSFASDEDNNIDPSSLIVTSAPDFGTVDTDTPGEITYIPANGFSGEDNFNVQIQDLNRAYSNVGTITITVSNEAPTAIDDSYTTSEDRSIVMNVLENDTDPQNNLSNSSLIVIDAPSLGTAEVHITDGTITYTPNANEYGEDSFTYRICDEGGYCDQATVSITITPVNDAPLVNDDNFTLDEDSNLDLAILENDSDIDGSLNTASLAIITDATNGTLTINDNTINYSPDADYNGSDSFVYSVADNEGISEQAMVSITINAVNDAPVAIDDEGETSDVASVVINVLANDYDVDDNLDLASLSILKFPDNGSVEINGTTGNITYEPNENYFGTDNYQYQICDTDGECTEATVRITVTSGNTKPIANPDYKQVDEDGQISFSPLENDNDPNNNLDVESLEIIEGPKFGIHQHTEGSDIIVYTPNANYFGNDTIVYRIYDQGSPSLSDQDTVFITVNPVNDLPVAADYNLDVFEGIPATVNLAELGSDIEMGVLTISIADNTNIGGTARVLDDQQTLEYTANFGTRCLAFELFYTLRDEEGGEDDATVFIDVIPMDTDNDNIPDHIENPDNNNRDSDNDGIPDFEDDDSDGDGISDIIEGGISNICTDMPLDTDNDGVPNYLDKDSDNDTVPDNEEGIADCDNDGLANYIDSFDDCADRASIDVPETFTPNGDGINDYFIIKGATSEDLKNNELFVFNRWGGQVYHMVNYNNTWDGKSNSATLGSEELSEGTYFYVFKSKTGTLIKGTVYIKR
ncbi:putative Ig domain-containing protein [Carboxylicivirga sp. RSCT41]|uniref:putative Ig domain-containing protein n=1 Tax=Carboxylicivirga agarovorans TaxID=3417570 RepID=UPI003D34C461